ncbi:hypothetical protein Nepgr_019592 [Nepenthes gracilis]|uniref:Uncharacterized protein n=1 Tax=Nepenthes gracilis TaxID=150966 RepID=A0AAD3SXD0_NEPGR|nr:hypothetical protein Nepgr_019592 [Nepenthes gracilis]
MSRCTRASNSKIPGFVGNKSQGSQNQPQKLQQTTIHRKDNVAKGHPNLEPSANPEASGELDVARGHQRWIDREKHSNSSNKAMPLQRPAKLHLSLHTNVDALCTNTGVDTSGSLESTAVNVGPSLQIDHVFGNGNSEGINVIQMNLDDGGFAIELESLPINSHQYIGKLSRECAAPGSVMPCLEDFVEGRIPENITCKDRVGTEYDAPLPYPTPCTLSTPLDNMHQINLCPHGGLDVDGNKPVSVLSNMENHQLDDMHPADAVIDESLAADSSPSPHAAPTDQHGKAPGSAQLALEVAICDGVAAGWMSCIECRFMIAPRFEMAVLTGMLRHVASMDQDACYPTCI